MSQQLEKPRAPIAQNGSSPTETTTGGFSNLVQTLPAWLLVKGLAKLRALSPQLVPFAIFLLILPLLVFLAIAAGWVVWRAAAVNWNVDVYLQYGCVVPSTSSFMPTTFSGQGWNPTLRLGKSANVGPKATLRHLTAPRHSRMRVKLGTREFHDIFDALHTDE